MNTSNNDVRICYLCKTPETEIQILILCNYCGKVYCGYLWCKGICKGCKESGCKRCCGYNLKSFCKDCQNT